MPLEKGRGFLVLRGAPGRTFPLAVADETAPRAGGEDEAGNGWKMFLLHDGRPGAPALRVGVCRGGVGSQGAGW